MSRREPLLVKVGLLLAPLLLNGCASLVPAAHAAAAAIAAHGTAATLAVGAGAGAVAGLAVPEISKLLTNDQERRQSAAEPGTFGAFLASTDAEVRNLVDRGRQSQRDALVVAGIRIRHVAARARTVFRDSLSKSVSSLGEPEKTLKAELEALVASLYAPADAAIADAGERARMLAFKMRPSSAVPLLDSSGPFFLFVSEPFQRIAVSGTFPADYARDSVPRLSLGARSYPAYDYSPDRLWFSVPTADLVADEEAPIAWKTGTLSVPWSPPQGFFSAPQIEQLAVEIAVLPFSFGRMSVEYTVPTVRKEEQTQRSAPFSVDSAQVEAGERCLALTPQELADGWRILRGTSAFVPAAGSTRDTTAWILNLLSESEQSVCWSARTAHPEYAAPRSAAAAGWRISATIRREVKELRTIQESAYLGWGSRRQFTSAGSWKLRYSRKGLNDVELSAAETAHPLIRVSSDGAEVTVKTYPF